DLVDDGVIGEIDQEDLNGGFRKDILGALGGAGQCVLYSIWRRVVINAHMDAHGMRLGWVMQVNDSGLDDFAVGDVEIDVVVGAKACRAPVDLAHFTEGLAYP